MQVASIRGCFMPENAPKMGEARLLISRCREIPAIRERPGDAYTTTSTGNTPGYNTKESPAKEPYAHTHSNHTRWDSTCLPRSGLRPHALGPYSRFPVLGIDRRPAHISVHLSTTFLLMRRLGA